MKEIDEIPTLESDIARTYARTCYYQTTQCTRMRIAYRYSPETVVIWDIIYPNLILKTILLFLISNYKVNPNL